MSAVRNLLGALLFGGALAFAGGGDPGCDLQRVDQQLREGKRKEAIDLLAKLAKRDAVEIGVHLRYQDVMRGAGRENDVVEFYRARAEADPQDPQAQYLYLRLLPGARACAPLRRLVRKHETYAPAWAAYASALRESGRITRANRASKRALELDPTSAEAHYAHGWILEGLSDPDGAQRHYREAIRRRPDFLQPRYRLAHLLVGKGGADSLKLLDEAESISPGDPRTRIHRGIVLGALGRDKEAVEAYRSALHDTEEDPLVLVLLCESYSDLSEWALAERAVTRALELDPGLADAHAARGYIHFRREEYEDAWKCYREAARREPKEGRYAYFQGMVLERWGKLAKAISSYRRAAAREPDNAAFQLALGGALERAGDLAAAQRAYKQAVRRQPNEIDLWIRLGYVASDLRKPKDAVEAWTKALELEPGNTDVLFALGITYETALHDKANALDCYRRYRRAGGKDARVAEWIAALEK